MKKLLNTSLVILILFLFVRVQLIHGSSFSGSFNAKLGGVSTACETPDNGDVLDEGFLGNGDGYENTWGETVGTGGSIDPDFSLSGTPLADSCSEGVNVIGTGSASGNDTVITWDNGSTIPTSQIINIYAQVYIDSVVLNEWSRMWLINWDDDTSIWNRTNPASITLYRTTGGYFITGDGSSFSSNIDLNEDTWLQLILHIESGADNSYVQCTTGCSDSGQKTFTANAVEGRYLTFGFAREDNASVDVEAGYIYLNTP